MAKAPENVEKFMEELYEKIVAKGKEELDELHKLKKDELKDDSVSFDPWDKMFYGNL